MALMNDGNKRVNLTDVYKLLAHEDDAAFCKGDFYYYHYGCDGVDDRGWGCGYRTLQTLCSWAKFSNKLLAPSKVKSSSGPNIEQIQAALIEVGDKPNSFQHSKQWIGSIEVCLCLDIFYDMPCKIIHVEKGSMFDQFVTQLFNHFITLGAPVMMGGETDNSSKGIIGVRLKKPALLVADPHYFGPAKSAEQLMQSGFIKWLEISQLHADSFYNLCLPQPSQPCGK